jgi:serpin B
MNYTRSDQIASDLNKDVVAANTGFSLRLLSELQAEDPGGNVFISPLSVSTTLAMIYNGADGSTREAMAETLGLEAMRVDEVNKGYADLIESLAEADKGVIVNVADSIWIEKFIAPSTKTSFTNAMEEFYGGGIFVRDFNNRTVGEINDWVSNQTMGKITRIVDRLDDPALVMVLVNTIYFRGNWTHPFIQIRTSEGNFTLEDGTVVKVPTMYVDDEFGYFRDNSSGAEALRLSYGRDKIAMYVLLPPKGEGLGSYAASLDSAELDGIISGMTTDDRVVKFPKLQLEYEAKSLKVALTKMGMGVAFGGAADFSNMIDGGGVWIDDVYHKTIVEINEKGTTAAGVSKAGIKMGFGPPPVSVDRPFIFFIRDDRTGSILFIGAVYDPTQTTSP